MGGLGVCLLGLLFGMVNSVTEWYRPGGAHGRQEVEDALVAVAFAGLRV